MLYAALLHHMQITLYTDQQQFAGYICFIPTFYFHLQRQIIKFNNAPCCLSDATSFYILREHSSHNTITQSQGTPHFTCQSARSGKTSSAPVHRADGSRKLCVLHETCSHFQRFHPVWSILIAYLGNNSLPVSLQLWPAERRSGAVVVFLKPNPETVSHTDNKLTKTAEVLTAQHSDRWGAVSEGWKQFKESRYS